jgi:paraquat-inducible protein A
VSEDRLFVALLIFIFSVVIPLTKTSLITSVYFTKSVEFQHKISKFVAVIGKWSMADVFVVAIFLAVLSTDHAQSAEQHQLSFFGMSIDFEISTQTLSNVGMGFYYFVGYCVVSLIGSQLMLSAINRSQNTIGNNKLSKIADNKPENGVE